MYSRHGIRIKEKKDRQTQLENFKSKSYEDFSPNEEIEINEFNEDFYKKIEELCGISVDVISTAPDDAGTIMLNQSI